MTHPFNQEETLVRCPHCSAINSLGETACAACGRPLRLTNSYVTGPLDRTPTALVMRDRDTEPLTSQRIVLLQVMPSGVCVTLTDRPSITLGRPTSPSSDYLDLAPYNGVRQGVSRRHCRLDRRHNHLYLTDLNSTNGTYLNGEPIKPGLSYPIADGDQIVLGLLYLTVFFGEPATELPDTDPLLEHWADMPDNTPDETLLTPPVD